jgi:hypothetical protein
MMQGMTAEERAQELVLRAPVLPELLSIDDPVRIVSELLQHPLVDDEDGYYCPSCDTLRDERDDLESDNNDLEVFAQGVREALGLAPATILDDVLERLKARLKPAGEGA